MVRNERPILLVEDDKVDALTVERALDDINVPNKLIHFRNGEEALEYLESTDPKKLPGIILLDLNMPKMNGIEFLREIKDREVLRRIPVIVLTTSAEEQDKIESFRLSVAGYMVKPVNYDRFIDMMKTINSYWNYSQLP